MEVYGGGLARGFDGAGALHIGKYGYTRTSLCWALYSQEKGLLKGMTSKLLCKGTIRQLVMDRDSGISGIRLRRLAVSKRWYLLASLWRTLDNMTLLSSTSWSLGTSGYWQLLGVV